MFIYIRRLGRPGIVHSTWSHLLHPPRLAPQSATAAAVAAAVGKVCLAETGCDLLYWLSVLDGGVEVGYR